jgi:drug/metabolite transporter (DMT)-like permease
MTRTRVAIATSLAMFAFAGNSLLCRLALKQTHIDALTFTSVRLVAGAVMLWLIVRFRDGTPKVQGDVWSSLALFAYAIFFSLAYVSLPAATGALLLFGAVQATMIGVGFWSGERLRALSGVGVVCAFAGLIVLVLPGVAAPPIGGSALMIGAGVAWGIYSLRGRRLAGDPTQVTAGNFMRAVPLAIVLSLVNWRGMLIDPHGIAYAIASGALASGIGYAIWYTALPGLPATLAAIVQLIVPVITAFGGVVLLGEDMSIRLVVATIAILGGIALVIVGRAKHA